MKTYKQLTYEQRCQIYALNKTGLSQNKIAKQLNVSQSTISREFQRNKGKRGYRIKQAQTLSNERRLSACKAIKMTKRLTQLIDLRIEKSGARSKYRVDSGKRRILRLAMRRFIFIFGRINAKVASSLSLRRKGKAYQSRRSRVY
ncbi:helix-turn-helix domain-containing protein [Pseudoalteromonas sp. Z1A8]|uniref:helix-turn-helix domain-containing protein n=1 Tax=Pseudoalteromonas sp. Z1A8 TaxID=2686354 RepID=UPI001F0CE2C3|nr:helix-turn-helix domain-containing protein [Pseudoalteromonas sp. Z1A8]